ncbi:MAG: VanZ family protein [Gemmatimonadales bacterium]
MSSVMQRMQSRTFRRSIVVLYTIGLLIATLSPLPSTSYDAVRGIDKLVHVVLFGGLSAVLYWVGLSGTWRAMGTGVAIAIATAGLIEILQGLLAYRSADGMDFVAGSIGAVVGVGAATGMGQVWSRLLVHRKCSEPS